MLRLHAGLLLAGLAIFGLMGASQAIFGPSIPAFIRHFTLAPAEAGLVISAQWVGTATGIALMFFFGDRISDRLGPELAAFFMATGTAIVALQPGWAGVLLGAWITGTGFGLATSVFNPRFLSAFGLRGSAMLGLLNASFGIGAILSPLAFLALNGAPALGFGLMAVLCTLVLLALVARRYGATPIATQRMDGAALSRPTAPGFRLHWGILGFGLVAIGMEASLVGLGTSALIAAGMSETAATEQLSAFFLAFVAARIGLALAGHLLGSFTIFTAAMLIAAVGGIMGALWWPGPGFVAMGVSAGLFFPGFYVTAARLMGADFRVPPVIIAAGLAGGIAAPLILGPMMGHLGERGYFWVLGLIAIANSIAALASLRKMAG